MNVMQEFADFSVNFNVDIMGIKTIITSPLPKLKTELSIYENNIIIGEYQDKLIAERLTLVTSLALLNQYLDKAILEYLPERTKASTDLSRKASLDASVSPIRYLRDVCEGTLETLDLKLEFMNTHYHD